MGDVAQNHSMWNGSYDWSQQGDEWSEVWGGVSYQWWVTLFSRIQGFVPAGRILEIAPGYGRWTHYLRDLCEDLVIVDIAETAVEHCRRRFADDERVRAFVNDGTSLDMVEDSSVDFVFSFDSLVHAEQSVLSGYLHEFARVLSPNGVAFVHHSNLGSYEDAGQLHNPGWRATSVDARSVAEAASMSGLSAINQETVIWGPVSEMNDCFSVITRRGSRWDRPPTVTANPDFLRHEAATAKQIAAHYPPMRPEVRVFALAEQRDPSEERDALRSELTQNLDPETLNDLAALTFACGEEDEARVLLNALVTLFPAHEAGRQNLAALG